MVFRGRGVVELEEFEQESARPGTAALRTLYSLVSTGTELTILNASWEPGSHWERFAEFPVYPGYAAAAEVVETGADADGLQVGDRVAVAVTHASHHVVSAELCTPIPDGVSPADAPWFGLAKISLIGARAAAHCLGQTVAVLGAGPIGQMSVRWANAAGAREVVVVATSAKRLELAREGGATATVCKSADDAMEDVRAVVGDAGPDVVIDATGNPRILPTALALVRSFGRVVILGDSGAGQHLTSDVLMRGLTIVGAHGSHGRLAPNAEGDSKINGLFFHLLRTGRFSLAGLSSHTFTPRDCGAAYRLANERRGETLGIVFDWSGAN